MENQEPVVISKNGLVNEKELTDYFKKLDDYITRLEKNIEAVADNGFRINMLEERTSQNSRLIDRIFYDIEKLKETLSYVENKVLLSVKKNKYRERVFWGSLCLVSALTGFFVSNLLYGVFIS